MRIAICTDQYLPLLSGIADSIETLKNGLKDRGHEVRIYAPAIPGCVPDPDIMHLPQVSIPGSANSLAVVAPVGMLRDLRDFNPDVIHTHTTGITGLCGLYASRVLKVPLVGTSHTLPASYLHYFKLDSMLGRYLIRKYTAWYFDRCAALSAPSQAMLNELSTYGAKTPMQVISNPIRTDIFRPLTEKDELKKKWRIPSRSMLLFGRIALEKDVDVALEVFARVSRESDTTLVVVGDGPYREEFEAHVRARRLNKRVMLLGLRRGIELVEIINACDVFLITSRSENQPLTLLQIMTCGIPAVAAKAGGLPEYVADNVTGFVVEANDVKGFARRLQQLLSNKELSRQFGHAAHDASVQFSAKKSVDGFEQFYTNTRSVFSERE